MTWNVWQQFIEVNGQQAPNALVEVRNMSDNSIAVIKADSSGSALGNPFNADSIGYAEFYAEGGLYKITATASGDSFSFINVAIGGASGYDVGSLDGNVLDKAAADSLYASTRKYNVSDTAPTVNDDVNSGYYAGSQWLRPTSGELYQSFSGTVGAADWRQIDTGVTLGTMSVKDEGTGAAEFRNNQDNEAIFSTQGALDAVEVALQADIDGKITDAPIDGKAYSRKDAGWVEASTGGTGDVEEAPNDGQPYARKNEAWIKSPDAKASLSTGIIGNVAASINADDTKIDVSYDGAVFVDTSNGTYKTISNASFTAVTVPNIASQDLSYFGVDSNSNLVFQGSDFTAEQRRDFVKIGVALHSNRASISSVTLNPAKADDVGGLVTDYMESIPPLNISGNTIEPASTDNSIKRIAGRVFGRAINVMNSSKSPNILITAEDNPVTFFTNYRAGGGSGVIFDIGTQIDFTKWDDGSGTLQTISGNDSSVKRVYFFPASLDIAIMYGQTSYTNFSNALDGYLSETFEQRNDVSAGIFLGWIIGQSNVTDLADAISNDQARIIPASSASAGGTGAGFDPNENIIFTGSCSFLSEVTVGSPTQGSSATTKQYVDDLAVNPLILKSQTLSQVYLFPAKQDLYVYGVGAGDFAATLPASSGLSKGDRCNVFMTGTTSTNITRVRVNPNGSDVIYGNSSSVLAFNVLSSASYRGRKISFEWSGNSALGWIMSEEDITVN